MSRRIQYWVLVIAGALGAAWALWALGLAVGETAADGGSGALLTSPTIQHKIGELMIAAPLFLVAFVRATRDNPSAAALAWRSWPVTLIGAGLNALAWWGAQGPWTGFSRLWFAGLVVVGVAGPPLIARLLRR